MPRTEGPPAQPTDGSVAAFGALLTRLAKKAGYDVEPQRGGRKDLAEKMGMSVSAIGRNLDGISLPRLSQFVPWARAVNVPVRTLMVDGGLVPPEEWPENAVGSVPSVAPSPGVICDALGIRDPMVRGMLEGSIEQAQRMQREADGQAATARGH
ncbi:XRE family transcriptional regulator [Streptomyces sp. NPDC001552]|uniref:XRE family transcriptional regulator n=1 Tax=Streptomyces sp. NPDC001552 TaxID=3364587 RepID=UPI003690CC24